MGPPPYTDASLLLTRKYIPPNARLRANEPHTLPSLIYHEAAVNRASFAIRKLKLSTQLAQIHRSTIRMCVRVQRKDPFVLLFPYITFLRIIQKYWGIRGLSYSNSSTNLEFVSSFLNAMEESVKKQEYIQQLPNTDLKCSIEYASSFSNYARQKFGDNYEVILDIVRYSPQSKLLQKYCNEHEQNVETILGEEMPEAKPEAKPITTNL